ncbi:MAG: hypothetical protein ACFCUN_01345 [Hyphomicrobiaceae bacterium]
MIKRSQADSLEAEALALGQPSTSTRSGPLTEQDAVDIWIARWLRIRRKDIRTRYACDPRRLYEIWEGTRFPASREKALTVFRERFPGLIAQCDLSHHRRIPIRQRCSHQLSLFD